MAKGAWVMRTAVMVSILAHASLIGAAGLRKPSPAPVEPPPEANILGGTTFLPVDSEELVDVDTMGGSAPETPPAAPPAPIAPSGNDDQDEAPVELPQAPSVPDKPVPKDQPKAEDKPAPKPAPKTPEAPKPKPDTDKPEPKDETSPDKIPEPAPEKPAPKTKPIETKKSPASEQDKPADSDKPVAQDEPAPEIDKKPARTAKLPKPAPVAPAAAPASSEAASDTSVANPAGGGAFGTDAATSIRNLGHAFTKALPPACDSDKVWATLAVGDAGAIEVALIVSEEGKVTAFEPITPNPPAHMMSTVRRTVANVKRNMAAMSAGSVNPGQHVLRLSAKLSDTTVTEEEVSGAAAFGLASTWEGRKGIASFTQPTGRHVEITVEFVRVIAPKM